MSDVLPPSADHKKITVNDITIHVVTAGPSDGTPVVLLHGFPEFWYGWRHQIPALVDAGYRVIVPDQRGYNRSEKPSGIEAYTIDSAVADVLELIAVLGYDRAHFVGHDWGAGVVWQILLRHQQQVMNAVTMNVPHPEVFREFLTRKPSQIVKSWYIFFFQLPRIPELLLSADDWRGLRWFIDTSNQEETFTASELEMYREAWSRPDAFTGMINWYRAMVQETVNEPPSVMIDAPLLLIWGTQDPYLRSEMAQQSMEYCSNGRLERIPEATHWLQHEVPCRINDRLLSFLEN